MLQIIGILLVLCLYYIWNQRKNYILSWKLNAFWGLPVLGAAYKTISNEETLKFLGVLHQYKRPTVLWLGPWCYLYVSDPVSFERILTSPEFINKGQNYKVFKDIFGDGLFISDEKIWKGHRKMFNPCFSQKVLLAFFPIFNTKVNTLLEILKANIGNKDVVMNNFLDECILDVACETLMRNNKEIQRKNYDFFFHEIHLGMELIGKRLRMPWLQTDIIYQLSPYFKQHIQTKKTFEEFINSMITPKLTSKIEQGLEINSEEVKESNTENTLFIDKCVAAVLDDSNPFSLKDFETEAKTMVAGALDTTSTTMYFIVLCLSMYPEYREKLFEELCSIFPSKDFEVTYEDTTKMEYTEMIINESLRLFPTAPLITRTAKSDTIFKDDIVVPKGKEVLMDIFHMNRDEKYWGPDAMSFNPDHFLPENLKEKHPYLFMAFSKGPRSCIGIRYGYFLLKVIIAKVFRNYYFSTDTKFEDLEYRLSITLRLKVNPKFEIFPTTK